jgi:lipopolysaccharide export LptBFGC system permease protein LptF
MRTGVETARNRDHVRKFEAAQNPFGYHYVRDFCLNVAFNVFAVMTLFELIFLAERFPMVFREALENNADLLDMAIVLGLNSTQIFDLALAIAILMSVYWATLGKRENRELLVLFAAGIGPYQIIALILAIAFAAQLGSLAISGLVDPASRYAQRAVLFDAEFRALKNGINTGQFYFFPNRVAYAPAQTAAPERRASPNQTRKLFIYQQDDPKTFRVITADRAQLEGPDPSGTIFVKLFDFTTRTFSFAATGIGMTSPPPNDSWRPNTAAGMTISAVAVTRPMSLDELLTFLPRGSKPEELTVFEQLGPKTPPTSAMRRQEMRLLGERFARSLLCLLAPLMALLSVCLTTRATNYLALPVACMALMSLHLTSEWLIKTLAPMSPLGALAAPAALTALFAALLLGELLNKQGELVRPQLLQP